MGRRIIENKRGECGDVHDVNNAGESDRGVVGGAELSPASGSAVPEVYKTPLCSRLFHLPPTLLILVLTARELFVIVPSSFHRNGRPDKRSPGRAASRDTTLSAQI